VFGQVTNGMDVIDGVAKGEPPAHPTKIEKMTVAADSDAAAAKAAN
jgi:peptidylprolyl isomerase